MNPRKGYRENVAEQERRMIELEHKLEVVTRQRDELAEALKATLGHSHEDWPCQICENARKALATKEGGA